MGHRELGSHANHTAVIDADGSLGCGTCVERCQVHVIPEQHGAAVVDRGRCIGCGLCVTGCPSDVAKLERRAGADVVHPPGGYRSWEHARPLSRGLIE